MVEVSALHELGLLLLVVIGAPLFCVAVQRWIDRRDLHKQVRQVNQWKANR